MATEGARVKLPIALTKSRALYRAASPFRGIVAWPPVRAGHRDGRHDGVHDIGFAEIGQHLAERVPVVLPRIFCGRGLRPCPACISSRQNQKLSALGFGDRGPDRDFSGPDCARLRRRAADGMAVGVIMGAQAGAEFARLRPACARVRARGETARQRLGAVPDRAVPLFRRHACAGARRAARGVRHVAAGVVVGGRDADHHRIRRRGAAHPLGPSARRLCHDLRHRHFRIVDRYSGHRFRRRKPPAQFHPDLGSRQQGAVLPDARPVGDRGNHPYAATARSAGQDRQ